MSDPACRNYRELLGVYVVGAIEPNERSMLDVHLKQCYSCREELAGLAVLPAMLHRIPLDEAEELAQPNPMGHDPEDLAPQVLDHLLDDVRARRRSRRLRNVLAAAAAIVVAASGSLAVSAALHPQQHAPSVAFDVVSNREHGLWGTVKYAKSPGGTQIWTRVTGVPEWTWCKFYVSTSDGNTELVSGWLIGPGGDGLWFPSSANVAATSIIGFTLMANGRVLLNIPA